MTKVQSVRKVHKNNRLKAFRTSKRLSKFGAVEQIRTVDLFLTKEVLCLLSYNSISS